MNGDVFIYLIASHIPDRPRAINYGAERNSHILENDVDPTKGVEISICRRDRSAAYFERSSAREHAIIAIGRAVGLGFSVDSVVIVECEAISDARVSTNVESVSIVCPR